MDVKSLAAVTFSTLLAASLTYAGSNNDMDTFDLAQASGTSTMSGAAGLMGNTDVTGNTNVGASASASGTNTTMSSAANVGASNSASNPSSSSDDMSADTATGDDDY